MHRKVAPFATGFNPESRCSIFKLTHYPKEEPQPEATATAAAASPYTAKRLPDDSIPF